MLSTWSSHLRSFLIVTLNILADFTISKALPLALRETVSKLLSLRKSILSSLHLSEFSLNLLSFDQQRTSCTVSWSIDAPDLGTISETVVSSAHFHIIEERVLLIVRSLIITKKSHGPIRVPCGIPAGTSVKSEKQSELSLTRWYLCFKKFATPLTTVGFNIKLMFNFECAISLSVMINQNVCGGYCLASAEGWWYETHVIVFKLLSH